MLCDEIDQPVLVQPAQQLWHPDTVRKGLTASSRAMACQQLNNGMPLQQAQQRVDEHMDRLQENNICCLPKVNGKILAVDLDVVSKVRSMCTEPLAQCIFITNENTAREKPKRSQSIAREVCLSFVGEYWFDAVFAVANPSQLQQVRESVSSSSHGSILLWIDLTACGDKLFKTAQVWLDEMLDGQTEQELCVMFTAKGDDHQRLCGWRPALEVVEYSADEQGGIDASHLKMELRMHHISDDGGNVPRVLDQHTPDEIVAALAIKEIDVKSVYCDEDGSISAVVVIHNIRFLHYLRDLVLRGTLEAHLQSQLSTSSIRCDRSSFAASYESITLQLDQLTPEQHTVAGQILKLRRVHLTAPPGN